MLVCIEQIKPGQIVANEPRSLAEQVIRKQHKNSISKVMIIFWIEKINGSWPTIIEKKARIQKKPH
jgi:hypothetical protein